MWASVRQHVPFLFLWLMLALPAAAQPRINMIGIPKGSQPAEAAARRVALGSNLQFMVVPRNGELFDPLAFEAAWNGSKAASFAYYPTADFALVFVSLSKDEMVGGGKLAVQGRTLEAGKSFSKTFAIDDPSSGTVFLEPAKTSTQILDENGAPFRRAYFFGQRRGDLFAVADEDGRVGLTAYERNTPEPHLAWAPGYWTECYDPRTSSTVQLERAPRGVQGQMIPADEFPESAGNRKVALLVIDEKGKPIPGTLVCVDRTWWTRGDAAGNVAAFTRPGSSRAQLIVLASGFRSRAIDVSVGDKQARLVLPGKPQPPTPQSTGSAK